ncbi:MAG: hypothetical protein U0166_12245 [Acidobacteriota bacterium]
MSEVDPSRRALLMRIAGRAAPESERDVAREFVRLYHERQDPASAARLAAGPLELRCLDEGARAHGDRSDGPAVSVAEHAVEAGGRHSLLLRVAPRGATPFERRASLTLERIDGRWRVTSLSEL